ncbi:MAG: GNAT family N-acetyltransferase [Steroidobacteraceae bacterium]
MEWIRDGFTISTEPAAVDRAAVAAALAETYWARGIPAETVYRSIDGSLCFSLRDASRQVGFARVVTDGATVAYLGDVFVLPEFQGRGLGQWLVECVMAHPQLQGMRRWMLVTADAHSLYEKFGFKTLARPEFFMELHNPNVYRKP